MSATSPAAEQAPGGPLPADRPRLADRVLRARAIYSMAPDRAVYRALAVRDEWIVAVAADQAVQAVRIGPGTRVVDVPELTLLPAFDDTHNHLMQAAANSGLVAVDGASSIAEVLALLRERAAQTPPGEWVRTANDWHESNLAEGRLPVAAELDVATTAHPV